MIFAESSALDQPERSTAQNLRRLGNHQIDLESFGQGHLQQLLQKALPVGDLARAPLVVHVVIGRSAFGAGDGQPPVLLLIVLVLRQLVGPRHPLQLQSVRPGVAGTRAGEALGRYVGEVLTKQIQKGLPATKKVGGEGLHGARSQDVVFRPVAQVEVEETGLE